MNANERKQLEQKLRESEENFRVFLEHAPAAVAMFDREMRYIVVSRRWMVDYGLAADIIGRSHTMFSQTAPHAYRRCLAGGVEQSDEDRFERADGSVYWLEWKDCRPSVLAVAQ